MLFSSCLLPLSYWQRFPFISMLTTTPFESHQLSLKSFKNNLLKLKLQRIFFCQAVCVNKLRQRLPPAPPTLFYDSGLDSLAAAAIWGLKHQTSLHSVLFLLLAELSFSKLIIFASQQFLNQILLIIIIIVDIWARSVVLAIFGSVPPLSTPVPSFLYLVHNHRGHLEHYLEHLAQCLEHLTHNLDHLAQYLERLAQCTVHTISGDIAQLLA